MARKTKKQKILADLRRETFFHRSFPNKELKTSEPEYLPTRQDREPKQQYQTDSLYSYQIQLVRKDLTKTLLLCILAISLEVALYFVFK